MRCLGFSYLFCVTNGLLFKHDAEENEIKQCVSKYLQLAICELFNQRFYLGKLIYKKNSPNGQIIILYISLLLTTKGRES